ncbi:MAG: winged helix-turn-helix transcriptional regulator [Desulfococcaceae bacterium]
MCFGKLRDAIIGVSEKMLIQNLRELERDGIVHREAYKQVPPKVEYSLTPMGKTTIPIMRAQFERGKRYASRLVAGEELEPGDVLQDIEELGVAG